MATEHATTEVKYCSTCGSDVTPDSEICPECGVALYSYRQEAPEPASRTFSAFLGGVGSLFVGLIPIIGFVGPIVGGILAGVLRGNDTRESMLTGILANVLASIPIVLLLGVFIFFSGLGVVAGRNGDAITIFVLYLVALVVGIGYMYVSGAIGGLIGAKITDRGSPGSK